MDPVAGRPHVIVAGGGHVSRAIARQARMLDFAWRYRVDDDAAFLRPASRLTIEGGRVVGLVLCSEQAADGADGRTAWLDLIAVRRAWRKRGVASAMMASALVALSEEGFRTAALDVDTDSPTGALDLYGRHGFRVRRTETVHALETPGSD